MRCENIYCVYQKNNLCRTTNVGITKDGRCNQFLHIILEDRDINFFKERTISLMTEPKNIQEIINKTFEE